MKNLFIPILLILVFNCNGGGGSSSIPTNCEQCVYNSMEDFMDVGSCDASDLNASGCIDMIQLVTVDAPIVYLHEYEEFFDVAIAPLPESENYQKISFIYYNTDFHITGFQFDIENMENISSVYNNHNFTVENSEPASIEGSRFLGYSIIGDAIPSGCGLLLMVMHWELENSNNFKISDIIFTDDTVNDDKSPNIMDVCPL